MDISNQLLAVQSILKKANREIIEAHMRCCVAQAMDGSERQEKIDEMLSLIDKISK